MGIKLVSHWDTVSFFLQKLQLKNCHKILIGGAQKKPLPLITMEILLSASSGALATHPTTTTTTSKTSTLTNKIQDQVRVLDPKTGTALLAFRQSAAQRHGLVVVKGPGSSYTYGGGRGNVGCDHVAISQQDRPAAGQRFAFGFGMGCLTLRRTRSRR